MSKCRVLRLSRMLHELPSTLSSSSHSNRDMRTITRVPSSSRVSLSFSLSLERAVSHSNRDMGIITRVVYDKYPYLLLHPLPSCYINLYLYPSRSMYVCIRQGMTYMSYVSYMTYMSHVSYMTYMCHVSYMTYVKVCLYTSRDACLQQAIPV